MFDWLQHIADWITTELLGLPLDTPLGKAVDFFLYDSTKILLLLVIVVSIMGIVNSYFPVDRVRHYLSTHKLYGLEHLMASLFGVVTPFCSCSSVPLFIGFVQGGIPLGVTFSFLVTSPLVNEVAIGLFLGLFGWKTTLIYVVSGVLLGVVSGLILGSMRLERYLTPWVRQLLEQSSRMQQAAEEGEAPMPFAERLPLIFEEVKKILKGVVPYVLAGIAVGAVMHGYVPEGFFARYLGSHHWWSVPLAVLLAVPMYANASGVLPVVQVLVAKGVPLGTAIAFMMAVVGLSLPEAMLLKKVMTLRLIGIFFGTVTVCIILSGYLFNLIL